MSENFKFTCLTTDWLFQSNALHSFLREGSGIDPYSLGEHYEDVKTYFLRTLLVDKYSPDDGPVLRDLSFQWDEALRFAGIGSSSNTTTKIKCK